MAKHFSTLIFLGFTIYYGLFVVASYHYPGGSDAFPDSTSYSLFHNYWCDLMAVGSKNCQPNPARPIALFAHVILAGILILYSYIFPFLFEKEKKIHQFIRICGILMGISFGLILTSLHNQAINFTGLFGVGLFGAAFSELLQKEFRPILGFFLICLILNVLSLFIYHTGWNIYYLPFLQKIVLIVSTSWIMWVTWLVRKKMNYNKKPHKSMTRGAQ